MTTDQEPTFEAPPEGDTAGRKAPPRNARVGLWEEASMMVVDASYSSRAHFIAGQWSRRRASVFGVPVVILSVAASTGAGTFAVLGVDKAVVALLAFAAAIMVALERHFDPSGNADAHSLKGDRYLTIRNEARLFQSTRIRSGDPQPVLDQEFRLLRFRYDQLRESAPRQLPKGAYDEARRQIQDKQASYEDDPLWVPAPDDLG